MDRQIVSPVPCEQRDTLLSIQLRQAAIGADVSSLKALVEDEIKPSMNKMEETISGLAPVIAHHASIVRRIEDIGWLISRWLIVGALTTVTGLVVWAIGKGFIPHP